MKRFLAFAMFVCASACGLHAQAVSTTVCDILKSPASFNNKIVSIKGTVSVGLDFFVVKDAKCGLDVNSIWISYPDKSKAKAGPPAVVLVQPAHNFGGTYTAQSRTPVTLQKDGEFKKFDSLLSSTHDKGNGLCLGCVDDDVTATLTGRIDAVASTEIKRDGSKIIGISGFGNFSAYPVRIVLQSVSGVTAVPIDYSSTDYTKGKPMQRVTSNVDLSSFHPGDPLDETQKAVIGLSGTPGGADIVAAADVFPQGGKHTGPGISIKLGYDTLNEDEKYDGQSSQDGPDGLVYTCVINMTNLPGPPRDALKLAIIHLGKHILEVRNAPPPNTTVNLFAQEYNDWIMTAEVGAAGRLKAVALAGSYELYLADWPQDQQAGNVDENVTDYLTKYQGLTK